MIKIMVIKRCTAMLGCKMSKKIVRKRLGRNNKKNKMKGKEKYHTIRQDKKIKNKK